MTDPTKLQALTSWLIAGAKLQDSYADIVDELARRLVNAGIGADMISIYQTPQNPLLGGHRMTWTPKGGVSRRNHTHAQMSSPLFVGGCVDHVRTGGRPLRYRVGETPAFDGHPGSARLISGGFSEYAIIPLIVSDDLNAVFAVATRLPGGLPDDQFDTCRKVAAPLARVVELHSLREEKQSLLTTYLGRDAGQRVASGMIRRGDAEMARAIILFTDIAGFTSLSGRLPIGETVALLNRYFEALETPVTQYGGDVLKLIGDGMLAIFPTPDDLTAEQSAALSALAAVADARAALAGSDIAFRAALHVGDVHYGNIGGLARLDFTAIGPAVNLAARLLDAAAETGSEITCSAAFAALTPNRVADLGAFTFKGIDTPEQVFSAS